EIARGRIINDGFECLTNLQGSETTPGLSEIGARRCAQGVEQCPCRSQVVKGRRIVYSLLDGRAGSPPEAPGIKAEASVLSRGPAASVGGIGGIVGGDERLCRADAAEHGGCARDGARRDGGAVEAEMAAHSR